MLVITCEFGTHIIINTMNLFTVVSLYTITYPRDDVGICILSTDDNCKGY